MELIKLLKVDGSAEPNAVIWHEGEEEYPVFLNSLINKIFFTEMINSGYKLGRLPYDFYKDGMSIMKLPCEVYQPTDAEMQNMYDMLGTPMSDDELRQYIDPNLATMQVEAKTHYTITTREQFLQYLLSIEDGMILDTDFFPINYFVAPTAQFDTAEYVDKANLKYVQIMSDRRRMSVKRFQNLVRWLSLPPTATLFDVVDKYFQWGLDGLRIDVFSKKEELWPVELTANAVYGRADSTEIKLTTYGFVNNSGRWLVAQEDNTYGWVSNHTDPKAYQEFVSTIPMGQSKLIELHTPATKRTCKWVAATGDLYYNVNNCAFRGKNYPTIRVYDEIDRSIKLTERAIMPGHEEELQECEQLAMLSKHIYEACHDRRIISSYKALLAVGLSPDSAIEYIAGKVGLLLGEGRTVIPGDDAVAPISVSDIKAYIGNRMITDEVEATCDAIVNGDINVDSIAVGRQLDATLNYTDVYNTVAAIHRVLRIPLADIYSEFCKGVQSKAANINFSYQGYTYSLNIAPRSKAFEGLQADLRRYLQEQANMARRGMYILTVARELSATPIPEEARPVGVEYLYFDCNQYNTQNPENAEAIRILEEIKASYATAVREQRPAQDHMSAIGQFAMISWFSIFFKGFYTLPVTLGGTKITASPQTAQAVRRLTKHGVDSLTAIAASRFFNGGSTNDMHLDICVVNAKIGIDFVVPSKEIREVPFMALWDRWVPDLQAKLIQTGTLPADHIPWTLRYEQQCRFGTDNPESTTSLTRYIQEARDAHNSWPNGVVFKTAYNFLCDSYPRLYQQIDSADCPNDPAATPRIKVSDVRMLTKDTYANAYLDFEELPPDPDQYIRPLVGLDPEAVLLTRFTSLDLPTGTSRKCLVNGSQVYFADTRESIDFTNLPKLGVTDFFKPVVGRYYILHTMDGKYWEVKI